MVSFRVVRKKEKKQLYNHRRQIRQTVESAWKREHWMRATEHWRPQSKCDAHTPGTDCALQLLARGTVSVKGHQGQMGIVRIRDATPCNRHTHICFQPKSFLHIIPIIKFNPIYLENRSLPVLFCSWLSLEHTHTYTHTHTHTHTQRNLFTWQHSIPTTSSNNGAIPHGCFLRMFFQWWPKQPPQPDLTPQPHPGTSIFQNLLWFLVKLLPSSNRENFSPHSFAPKTLF